MAMRHLGRCSFHGTYALRTYSFYQKLRMHSGLTTVVTHTYCRPILCGTGPLWTYSLTSVLSYFTSGKEDFLFSKIWVQKMYAIHHSRLSHQIRDE